MIYVAARFQGPLGEEVAAMALDTASTRSIIKRDLLTRVGCEPDENAQQFRVIMGLGAVALREARVSALTALGKERRSFPVLAHDFPGAGRFQGVLGLDFMRDLFIGLDFRDGTIDVD